MFLLRRDLLLQQLNGLLLLDSAVELLSAIVVLTRFWLGLGAEGRAARINAALLYALAGNVVLTSVFSLGSERVKPKPHPLA